EAGAVTPPKALQRLIRERLAAANGPGVDIRRAEVRAITLIEARSLILPYEWLGIMPAVGRLAFGIFFADHCGGAVVYGDEYGEDPRGGGRFGVCGEVIAALGGGLSPLGHPHFARKLVRPSLRNLPR